MCVYGVYGWGWGWGWGSGHAAKRIIHRKQSHTHKKVKFICDI